CVFKTEDGIRVFHVTGVQTCALPISDLLSSNIDNAWTAVKTVKTDSGWISENISGFALILVLGTAIIGSLFSSDAWNNVTFIARSEERRVGKECRCSMFPYNLARDQE